MDRRHPFNGSIILLIVAFGLGTTSCKTASDRPRTPADSATVSATTWTVAPPKPIEQMTRAERQAFVAVLRDSGAYRCCTDPACTSCLYEDDPRCRCSDALKAKDPVCGECYRGWQRGQGAVAGVEVASVQRR